MAPACKGIFQSQWRMCSGAVMRPAISVRCIRNLYVDKGRIARHIVPLLGTKRVRDLTSADINRFKRDVANGKTAVTEKIQKKRGRSIVEGGKGTATRTAGLLGGIRAISGKRSRQAPCAWVSTSQSTASSGGC